MATDSSFLGMDELLANLQQIGSKASSVENEALRAGAEVLREEISKKAPRSMSNKKHAADHIAISKVKLQGGVKHVLVGLEKGDNSEFFYLKFHEWGTSKMSARPFVEPAVASKQKAIVEAMADVVKGAIRL